MEEKAVKKTTIEELKAQLEEEKKKRIEAENKLVEKEQERVKKQIEKEDAEAKLNKKKYYEVVVHNKDVSDDEYDDIMFFANDKLVHIKPGENIIISQTAYENLSQRCIQVRHKPRKEFSDKPLEKYNYHRFPVVKLREMELTENEYVEEIKKLKKAS
jgi:membrane-bound lytic murein transglycosylase